MKKDWIDDKYKLEFYEYKLEVILLRISYFIVLYLIICPLLLKKKLDSLKPISMIFLVVIVFLIIDIMIEAPFFMNYYKKKDELDVTYTFKGFKWRK